jgi:hypothetical protein
MNKCPCNCHDPQFRKDTKTKEHEDCGICFMELFEEQQELNKPITNCDNFVGWMKEMCEELLKERKLI